MYIMCARFVQDVCMVCARCAKDEDVCKMCARCAQDVCKVCERYVQDVCKMCVKIRIILSDIIPKYFNSGVITIEQICRVGNV